MNGCSYLVAWQYQRCGNCKHYRKMRKRGCCLVKTTLDDKLLKGAVWEQDDACPRWEECE